MKNKEKRFYDKKTVSNIKNRKVWQVKLGGGGTEHNSIIL